MQVLRVRQSDEEEDQGVGAHAGVLPRVYRSAGSRAFCGDPFLFIFLLAREADPFWIRFNLASILEARACTTTDMHLYDGVPGRGPGAHMRVGRYLRITGL